MEFHAVMQMENVSLRVRDLPALREAGSNVEVIAAGEQVVEDQIVDALRLRILAYARVEICRARFNDHHQRARIRLRGA